MRTVGRHNEPASVVGPADRVSFAFGNEKLKIRARSARERYPG